MNLREFKRAVEDEDAGDNKDNKARDEEAVARMMKLGIIRMMKLSQR